METERVVLSLPKKSEYDNIFSLHNNEKVNKYVGGSISEEDFASFFKLIQNPKTAHLYFVVHNKDTKEFMGYVYIDPYKHKGRHQLSYEFLPEYWNQGYGTEVLKRIFEYAFKELQLDILYAEIHKENKASIALVNKMSMKPEDKIEPSESEEVVYSITKKEYLSG